MTTTPNDDAASADAGSVGEGFGGEPTPVVPDDAPSSRWDRNAQDEDALIAGGPEES